MDMDPSPLRVQPKINSERSVQAVLRVEKDNPVVNESKSNGGDPRRLIPNKENAKPKLAQL